ncbi:MAG: hypothetical protein HWD59_06945 [Coxiellaceae bacterium]|nr:MAG: hypothetical protein HWD59_06945 [Coxiellaceae bacterium]
MAWDGASLPAQHSFPLYEGDFQPSLCYNVSMKTLIETNPYLKDPATRKMLIERSVVTSCGVEGIKAASSHVVEIPHDRTHQVYLEMLNKRLSK